MNRILFDKGFMYESVRELELRPTARNEPKPKTEEERNGNAKGRREAGKEENSRETSRLGNGTSANNFGSNLDKQANALFAYPRQVTAEAEK